MLMSNNAHQYYFKYFFSDGPAGADDDGDDDGHFTSDVGNGLFGKLKTLSTTVAISQFAFPLLPYRQMQFNLLKTFITEPFKIPSRPCCPSLSGRVGRSGHIVYAFTLELLSLEQLGQ